MKQYRITSENLIQDSDNDCYLAPDDIAHELKILQHMGGLGALSRLHERNATLNQKQVNTSNAGQIQREQGIKPGTDEWFKLWFGKKDQ